ncbi:Y+L amino acid transporter [Elysia marginata]|uniref:Y+L amino acid transporter n=1 Tax=Elysia marginata TaxID=1093978 RepID=A0AAV4FXF9_9GAST|nr:Y+L amino acid transporter [Elysia marginata]
MPRQFPIFGNKTQETPIGVSLTSLKENHNGKDNLAFVSDQNHHPSSLAENTQNSGHLSTLSNGKANGSANGHADSNAISVISHNNILTHRNAPKSTGSDPSSNGAAHPLASAAGGKGQGASRGNSRTPTPASQSAAGPEAPKTDGVEMKKSINLLHMIAILVSVTGHSSIFIAPASILTQAGSIGAALLVWLFGGIIHLGQALCFAEMGTMFPGAGGPYAYAMKAFGPLMGFLMMWGYTILIAGPFWAFLARTAAVYILRPVFPSCTTSDIETATTVLAGWIIGWQVMTTMLAEVKNPSRDPPRAAYISFAIVISLYIMANVSYVTILSPSQVKTSTAVASDFIAEVSDVLAIIVSVLVALTSIGALNASIMGHSRLLFAGARNGHMPQILGMVHAKYLTPWPSIFVYTAWALVMLFTGGVVDMMDYIALFSTIMGIVVVAALLYLRWKKPDMERPYKVGEPFYSCYLLQPANITIIITIIIIIIITIITIFIVIIIIVIINMTTIIIIITIIIIVIIIIVIFNMTIIIIIIIMNIIIILILIITIIIIIIITFIIIIIIIMIIIVSQC